MAIIHADESSFGSLISNDLVLVDFYANWCGPCKMLSPILENIANERENVKIVKVDVDECETLARSYGIMSIPALLLFKNGKLKSQKVGFLPESELKKWIEEEK